MVERVVVGPWKTNCYIFSSSKKECIIIDPGGDEEEIASRVDVLNMVPIGIALTHGHVDHLAALGKLQSGYAARGYSLPIAISPADRRFLGSGALETHKESLKANAPDELAFFAGDASELPKADVRLREGDRVFTMDLIVLETPGHTPGSLCFYSEKEGVLFSGDTLFFDGVGRADLPGGSEKKLRESIEKKIAVLPPETRVFPGHGPFTTVERERRGNPFFRQPAPEPKRTEPPKPKRSESPKRTEPAKRHQPSKSSLAPARVPVKRRVVAATKARPTKVRRVRAQERSRVAAQRGGKPKSIPGRLAKRPSRATKPAARVKKTAVPRVRALRAAQSARRRPAKKKGGR